jgi:tetratricopeptide (TPR) repeat protein
MLGILAARPEPRPLAAIAPAEPRRTGGRVAIVVLATLVATGAIVSAAVPLLASSKSDAAASAAAGGTPAGLERAAAEADLAARLDPVSAQPLFVAAAVATARGRLLDARADLLEAADRTPEDPQVWARLSDIALELADRSGYLRATQRLFALDPHNPLARQRAAQATVFLAPPASSATATGTPLVAGSPAPLPPAG